MRSGEPNEPMADALGLRRLPAWATTLFGPLVADLKSVDSGSLDVLVYCGDDIAGGAPGVWGVAGGVDGP